MSAIEISNNPGEGGATAVPPAEVKPAEARPAGGPPAKKKSPAKLAVGWIVSIVVPIAIVLFLHLDVKPALCFGIILFGICCLIFDLLPNFVVGLGITFIPILINVTPANVALAPLTTWTWWSIIFGMIIGVAMKKTGLGRRIGISIAARLVKGWASFILVIFIVELLFNVIAPFANVATIAIGLSVFMPMAEELGFKPRSKGYTGIALAVVVSNTVTGALLLTGHAMNALAVALFAPYYQITFATWLQYITPIALIASVIAYLCIMIICRPKKESASWDVAEFKSHATELPKFSSNEARVLTITLIIMLGFLVQSLFKLPFDAGWLSMSLVIFLFIPKIGMLTGEDIKSIEWPFVLFMIGVFSIGGQLGFHGVSTALAAFAMPAGIENWNVVASDMYIFGVVVLLHFLCGTIAPLLSTLVPAFGAFGVANGMGLVALFSTILFCRTRFVFPFQDAMTLMAKGMTRNGMDDKEIIKVGVATTLLIFLIVIPIGSLYWGTFTIV